MKTNFNTLEVTTHTDAPAPIFDNADNAARLAAIAANIHAKNTTSAYQSDIEKFSAWLSTNGKEKTETALLEYLTELSATCKETTLRRKYVSLRRVVEVANPVIFRNFFKGVAKTLKQEGKTMKQAKAMHKDFLTDICGALPTSAAGIRNRALFLLCYYGAFRGSELVSLRWSDITPIDKGLQIHIDGKTGAMDKFIAYKAVNCPVAALKAWRNLNGGEYVFVKVDKGDTLQTTPLTRQGFNKILKGINGEFSTHSFRRGFVSDAFKVGATIPAIQAQTGHKLVSTVVRYCEKDITENNAVNLL
jgi:integrase